MFRRARTRAAWSLLICLAPLAAIAQANPRLTIPDFIALEKKAADSVTITLDPALLSMATRFLGGDDPKDVATKEILKGLQGIYVKSYTFNEDNAYRQADLDSVRAQLAAPGWSRLMQTHSQKTRADVDIYIMQVKNQAVGLALIASEARQLTIVNIVGTIDLDKLHKLQGQFGVPKFDFDPSKSPPPAPVK